MLLTGGLTSYAPGSDSCRVAAARIGAISRMPRFLCRGFHDFRDTEFVPRDEVCNILCLGIFTFRHFGILPFQQMTASVGGFCGQQTILPETF